MFSCMLNYQLEIVGEEFVNSIGHSDEFRVNLPFDRFIFIVKCAYIWVNVNDSQLLHPF